MNKTKASILMIATTLLNISCQKQNTEWRATTAEVDGVIVVKNPIEPLNPEMKIIFVEDLTIGVEEGDENYMKRYNFEILGYEQ